MPGDFSTGIAAGASAAFDALNSAGQHQPGGKVAGAARDFEALLLGQILKSAHGDGGWLGTSDDDAGSATGRSGRGAIGPHHGLERWPGPL
jgi:hypothetical protein